MFDPDHSDNEERFIIMGISNKLNILVVCHCYRCNDDTVRIISARKATKKETSVYNRRKKWEKNMILQMPLKILI